MNLDHVIKGIGTAPPEPEPAKGEHVEGSRWIINNPHWPEGEGEYMILCPGCEQCPEGE